MTTETKSNETKSINVGDFVRDLIIARHVLNDKTVEVKDIVLQAHAEFKSNTTAKNVHWYACQLRSLKVIN